MIKNCSTVKDINKKKPELESIIGELLTFKNRTLAIAESCTGGLIAHRITNIPGSSLYFQCGLTTYSNQAKIDLLGVYESTLQEFGAVSEQVAIQMAQGVRSLAKTDYGLGVTGIAGPGGATAQKPVGLVYVAACSDTNLLVKRFQFSGDRIRIKRLTSESALEMLKGIIEEE